MPVPFAERQIIMENIKERVSAVLVQVNKKVEPLLDSTSLVSSGILDSLDIMSLIMDLERAFEIEIDPEDVLSENFESVDAITALVEKCGS